MSDHRIKLTHENDTFSQELVCEAPEDAICRSLADCDCELYHALGRDEQGWFHTVDVEDEDEGGHVTSHEEKHRHTAGYKGCTYKDWIEDDGAYLGEYADPNQGVLDLGSFGIDITWDVSSQDYLWRKT